jgi:hypothetical protein
MYFDIEKNSEITGRILAACYSKVNKISDIIALEKAIWIDQNTKWTYKMMGFLTATPCYFKKYF